MSRIKLNDLTRDSQITAAEMKKVFGGAGPAGLQEVSVNAVNVRGLQLEGSGIVNPISPVADCYNCTCADADMLVQRKQGSNVYNAINQMDNIANNQAMNVSIGAKTQLR